ncbi:MAG: sigma-70 family RNA polymerase sigma factor [Bacteroidaceae bacterium]|nr:sigma-70 family RNA polymerase sigma factor [Bacteroidaceae bacterium]
MQKEDIERLYEAHHQRMYRLARMLLLDEAEAQDVVGDVFEHLLTMPEQKAVDAAYLLMAVRNACANVLKHRGVRQKVHRLYAEEARKEQRLHEEGSDRSEQLRHFVRTGLSPRLQEVFQLRFGDELKYREIAERLGVSEVMVYKYLSQIIKAIQTHFNSRQS